jgi:hypothetical protein
MIVANFSRINARYRKLELCPRCQCEIHEGDSHCFRCGLVLHPVVVWMIERQQRKDGHLHDRISEVSNAIEND